MKTVPGVLLLLLEACEGAWKACAHNFRWCMQVAAICEGPADKHTSATPASPSLSDMLMDGLGLSNILWALLSATPVRLLDVALRTVGPALISNL